MENKKEQTPEQLEIANLKAQLVQKDQVIAEQHEQLNELVEAGTSAVPTVTIEKKKYEVTAPTFAFDGTTYVAADLATNKKLAAQLVKVGAGFFKEIV